MKNLKKIIFGCSCILFLSVSNVVFAATGTVTGKTVRIRESADASSKIITNAYRNDTVEILATEGDWYKVEYVGKTGYMSKDFVEVKGNSVETTPIENTNPEPTNDTNNTENNQTNSGTEDKTTISKESSLKLLPSFSSTNLGIISQGTEVKVEQEINNWLQITAGSNTGWVLKNNVTGYEKSNIETTPEKTEPEATEPVVTEPEEEQTQELVSENKEDTKPQEYKNQIAYISTDTARVRASAGGKILGNLDLNDEITIIGEDGDWYKITCTEYPEGYVSKSLISTEKVSSRSLEEERTTEQESNTVVQEPVQPEQQPTPEVQVQTTTQTNNPVATPAPTPEPTPTPAPTTSNKGAEVVAYAKSFLGCRYISGGTSPNGFDCSGFTQYVYSHFGYSLARVASGQASNGVEVARSNLQLGDLVIFLDYGKSKIGHVGIYIGDGNFIHAANPSRGVVTDNLNSNSYYNQRYVCARRVF